MTHPVCQVMHKVEAPIFRNFDIDPWPAKCSRIIYIRWCHYWVVHWFFGVGGVWGGVAVFLFIFIIWCNYQIPYYMYYITSFAGHSTHHIIDILQLTPSKKSSWRGWIACRQCVIDPRKITLAHLKQYPILKMTYRYM